MAKYLAMEYSEDIYSWFSSSTIAIAKSIEWEAVLCKPISACETLHKDIEQISFSWEISKKASLTSPSSQPLVNFYALTVTSIDNPQPPDPSCLLPFQMLTPTKLLPVIPLWPPLPPPVC